MAKSSYLIILFVFSSLWLVLLQPLLQAETIAARLAGRLVLQVESKGEAWYINPLDGKRYFLGRPADAFQLMRTLGLGISEADFNRLSTEGRRRLAGRIILRVQSQGQAYYINPLDLKLHFLGRPADAFQLMRTLGLGISDNDLARLPLGFLPGPARPAAAETPSLIAEIEKSIHSLINQQRRQSGLAELKWNEQVAAVAREHSQNQADENQALISANRLCSYPFIHHEGQIFGLYHNDRLNRRQVHYFSAAAENIALIPQIKGGTYEQLVETEPSDCQADTNQLNQAYETRLDSATSTEAKLSLLKQEIAARAELLLDSPLIRVIDTTYNNPQEIEEKAVTGWMNSPGHRKNILDGSYDEAGVGVAQAKNYFIITQVFIKRASCGFQGGSCCQKAGYYPYCYQPLTCQNNTCSNN